MLFDQPWPCTLRTEQTCRVACISLAAVANVVLARPEIVFGAGRLAKEQLFAVTDKHSEMIALMRDQPVDSKTELDESPSLQSRDEVTRSDASSPAEASFARVPSTSPVNTLAAELRILMKLDNQWALESKQRVAEDKLVDELISLGGMNEAEASAALAARAERDDALAKAEATSQTKLPVVGDSLRELLTAALDRQYVRKATSAVNTKGNAFNASNKRAGGLATVLKDAAMPPEDAPDSSPKSLLARLTAEIQPSVHAVHG